MENVREVDFHTWCAKCKYRDRKEHEPPCDDCLRVGGRMNTSKPIYWKEK